MLILDNLDDNTIISSLDGQLVYRGTVLNEEKATKYFELLQELISWKNEKVFLFGKEIIMNRKTAWYGSKNFEYDYAGTKKIASIWNPILLELKDIVEAKTNQKYNACLLNFYHNGEDAMGWHTDNEPSIDATSSIACLSLGAHRFFDFKHNKTQTKYRCELSNGSLIEMLPPFQEYWKHQIPKQKKIKNARISLTFRSMKN